MTLKDEDLLYSENARCRCGAGLAYQFYVEGREKNPSSWTCSAVLKGTAEGNEHDSLPFAFWKVREEGSVNGCAGATTRPDGTIHRTVGYAKCPKCEWKWKSEPYDASEQKRHWRSGPCPECGYAVGGGSSYSTSEGKPIENRFKHTVVKKEP